MMKTITKLVGVVALGLLVSNCSATYQMKSEKGKVLNQVPKWYMADFSESKACDTPVFGKDKDKMCIFGVGTAVSPDLNLAIEKGMFAMKSKHYEKCFGELLGRTLHRTFTVIRSLFGVIGPMFGPALTSPPWPAEVDL